jgi:hypothetical protein
VKLSPLGTPVTNWPIVPDDRRVDGAFGGMRIGMGIVSTRRKPAWDLPDTKQERQSFHRDVFCVLTDRVLIHENVDAVRGVLQ